MTAKYPFYISCTKHCTTSCSLVISSAPRVLISALIRTSNELRKLEDPITVNEAIHLEVGGGLEVDSAEYRLSGMVSHLGASIQQGHCAASVRLSDGSWLGFNNSDIHKVPGQHLQHRRDSYLIIYERVEVKHGTNSKTSIRSPSGYGSSPGAPDSPASQPTSPAAGPSAQLPESIGSPRQHLPHSTLPGHSIVSSGKKHLAKLCDTDQLGTQMKLHLPDENTLTSLTLANNICFPSLLSNILKSASPPSIESFSAFPNILQEDMYWVVYLLILVKDGCVPKIYVGSSTDLTQGTSCWWCEYHLLQSMPTKIPRCVRLAAQQGYQFHKFLPLA